MIEHYSFGSIIINGKEYTHDVIVSSDGIKSWWRAVSHEVSINDLEAILQENPKVVVFGTGASGIMKILEETENYLEKQGIKFKVLRTAEAIKEFNQNLDKPNIIGAFHLTC